MDRFLLETDSPDGFPVLREGQSSGSSLYGVPPSVPPSEASCRNHPANVAVVLDVVAGILGEERRNELKAAAWKNALRIFPGSE